MGVCKPIRVVAALGILTAAACGARLSDTQVKAMATRGGQTVTTVRANVQGNVNSVASDGTTTQSGGFSPISNTGTGPTSTGTDTNTGTGQTCTPSGGALDVGIDDTTVTAGSVAVVGGPVPGLFTNVQLGTKAYFDYINATQNGVCGRKLKLLTADDRLDAGVNRAETENLIPRVFAFVGSYSVVDDGGASVLDGTGIPDIGSNIGVHRSAMANNFPMTPLPPGAQRNGSEGIWQYFQQNYGVQKLAVVWPAQNDARARGQAFARDAEAAGLTVLPPIEVAVTETNYTGVATKIKNDAADAVITALEINGISRLAQAFQQVGYKPKVPYYGQQAYGSQLLELAGPAAEGTVLAINHSIVEDAPNNPEMAAFAEWFTRVNPGADRDFFAIQGWIAGSMFAHALREAGPQPTRAKVLAVLQTYHAFDADGFIAPIDPAGKNPTKCFMVVTVENGQWKRVDPATGFRC